MKRNVLALFVLAAISLPAMAEDTGKRYIGFGYGSANFSNTSPSSSSSVFRFLTGYRFNPMLAMEIDYSMFGNFTVGNGVSSATVSASSLQIAAAGTYPVSQDFDLIGKVGLAQNMATGRGGQTIPGRSGDYIRHNDVFAGFGAQYRLTQHVNLHALYYNYGKFENAPSPIKASSISLGVTYNY